MFRLNSLVKSYVELIVTFSTESSILFVFLIILDRMIVLRFPYSKYRFSKPATIISVKTGWLVSFVLADVTAI